MAEMSELALARRVGVCIRDARRASGLSRDQVARSAGLTGRELSRYERGKSIPCGRDLQALAGACGVGPTEILPTDLVESLAEHAAVDATVGEFLGDGPRPIE